MRSRYVLLLSVVGAALALSPAGLRPLRAQPAPAVAGAALTGRVSSAEEGPMEGVLVSAKKAASTITTTVVTDRDGRYRFPASRLDAGTYALRIRAAGYDLQSAVTVDVAVQ